MSNRIKVKKTQQGSQFDVILLLSESQLNRSLVNKMNGI